MRKGIILIAILILVSTYSYAEDLSYIGYRAQITWGPFVELLEWEWISIAGGYYRTGHPTTHSSITKTLGENSLLWWSGYAHHSTPENPVAVYIAVQVQEVKYMTRPNWIGFCRVRFQVQENDIIYPWLPPSLWTWVLDKEKLIVGQPIRP